MGRSRRGPCASARRRFTTWKTICCCSSRATVARRRAFSKSKKRDSGMVDNLHFVKELGYQSKEALENGDLERFADLMNVHWQYKKQRSGGMSNPEIDRWYELARANGALGGKLIGAGGGGF